jgi:hypothetical protein
VHHSLIHVENGRPSVSVRSLGLLGSNAEVGEVVVVPEEPVAPAGVTDAVVVE